MHHERTKNNFFCSDYRHLFHGKSMSGLAFSTSSLTKSPSQQTFNINLLHTTLANCAVGVPRLPPRRSLQEKEWLEVGAGFVG